MNLCYVQIELIHIREMVKMFWNFILSLLAIIILAPVLIIISIFIKTTSKGPVLFKQRRVGKNNKEFIIYKFRTMSIDTPNVATNLLENPEVFITDVGRVLRKTSLDELPQLFNIIKGDMSIIGPRPALYNQYDLIEMRTKAGVESLVPGLTGWAQINGRDEISLELKVRLDKEYKEKMRLIFDVKIIFLTIIKVFKSEGVAEGRTKVDSSNDFSM